MMTSSPITKTLTMFVMISLMLVGFASADIVVTKYDHNAYLDSAYDKTFVCSCATTTDYFTVTNTGDFAAMFTFSLEAEMSWVSMQQKQAYLLPGESTRVAVDISPPCGLEQDPVYKVYSTSQYGRYRVAERAVTATVCESLQFALAQHTEQILPCTEATFTAYVKNIAPYTETYELRTNTEAVDFATDRVRLEPGQIAEIPATASWSCDVSGEQAITFEAEAGSSGSTHEKYATVNIVEDYEYTVSLLDSEPGVCAEVTTSKQILLTNIAQTPNTYTLKLSGTKVATLSEELVVLQPGQSKVVTLDVSPTEHQLGSLSNTLQVTNEFGDVDKTLTINHEVRDCYENIVTVTPASPQACTGWTDVNVRVENRGENTEDFLLIPEGEIYSEVSTQSLTLRPGEHADVTLNISVPDETAMRNVELTVRQTPGIDKVVTIPVDGYSNEACTQATVENQKYTVYRDERIVPVIITNDGIRASTYEFSLDSSVADIVEEATFLAPGEQTVLHVVIPGADQVADGQYVAELTIQSDRAQYRQDIHLSLRDKSIWTQAYERIAFGNAGTVDYCALGVLVYLVLFILIAIAVGLISTGRLPAWILNPSNAQMVRVILALIAVGFLLYAFYSFAVTEIPVTYEDDFAGSNYSELFHEFGANEIYDLDLNAYFSDPDGEGLTYTHSQPENLRIKIVDNVARIKAAGDFSGETQVVFTAQDPEGAAADSPIMTVRVVKDVPVTFWQWMCAYCDAVNHLLIALIALLLIAAIRDNPRGELVKLEDGTVVPANAPDIVKAEVGGSGIPAGKKNLVQGDVVAGDKVTIISSKEPELFVASMDGKKFHPIDSHFVERIPKEKRIVFRTKEEAIKAGYTPSKQVR